MGRFPRLRFDIEALGKIDAVYLTHAHCDHLDPYTLVRLWDELRHSPTLIIPVSLSYLVPVFQKYLHNPDIMILKPHEPTVFQTIALLGFFDVGQQSNNEEDVMVLVITHQQERVLIEADARLELSLINFRQYISMLMRDPKLESAVFLTTENELTGTMESRNCSTLSEREELYSYAFEELYESIHQLYVPVDDPQDLWHGKNVLRLIHGQGLTAPHELDNRWQKILFPVRIADRIQAEKDVSQSHGFQHSIAGLRVGYVHTIHKGKITKEQPLSGLLVLDKEEKRMFDIQLSFFPELPCAPIHMESRDIQTQQIKIIELLNEFFLPFLHGMRQPPVHHLLAEHQGEYRIRIYYGQRTNEQVFDYILGFQQLYFVQQEVSEKEPHEAYWANDLEDFSTGTCDEFSTFCRKQFPVPYMRLWSALATPLLNSNIVKKRIRLHFERARNGLSPGTWVVKKYHTPTISSIKE